MDNIKRNIKAYMKLNRWNQKQLAQESGVTESCISRLLAGENYPRIGVLKQIAYALGVPVSELLKEKEENVSNFEALKAIILRYRDELTVHEQLELVGMITGKGEKNNGK